MNSDSDQTDNSIYLELAAKLSALEKRVAQLESVSTTHSTPMVEDEDEAINFKFHASGDTQYESNIGEYGLAWLGNVVLFFGITFLVEFLQISGLKIVSSIFGFISVAGIFLLANYLQKSNPYMARIFNLNAYLLAFYVTMKLYFFTTDPIIASKGLGLILLLIVIGLVLFFSIRKKYQVLAGIAITLLTPKLIDLE